MTFFDFGNEIGPRLQDGTFYPPFKFNFTHFFLTCERKSNHKRFNEIIKEIFSKEVKQCEDADTAAVE